MNTERSKDRRPIIIRVILISGRIAVRPRERCVAQELLENEVAKWDWQAKDHGVRELASEIGAAES